MASNSTYLYSSNYPSSSPYTLTATVVQNSQNQVANTSNVTITASLTSGGAHFSGYSTPTLSVEYKDNNANTTYTAKKTEQISYCTSTTPTRSVSWTGDVTHKADGTLSVSVNAVWLYKDSGTGYAPKSGNVEVTLAMTTIPRAGSVSVSPVNATISSTNGTTILTATVTPQSTAYHHYVTATLNGSSVMSAIWAEDHSNQATIVDTALLTALGNNVSGTVTVTVKTYTAKNTSSTLIGTKTATASVTVDINSIKPSLSSVTMSLKTTPITSQWVAGYSTAYVNFTAARGYGATSSTTTVTLDHGSMATASTTAVGAQSLATNAFAASSTDYTLKATVRIVDGRGASAQIIVPVTVKGYTPPNITATAYRVASNGSTTADEAGAYAYITATATAKSLGSNAIQSFTAAYTGDISGSINSFPAWVALGEGQGITITFTATDLVTSATAARSVSVATFPVDLYQEGSTVGVGLGGVAEAGRVSSFLPHQTSFKKSFAMGSYGSSQTTVDGFVAEVRYSSGAMGSVSIGTAYTHNGVTIPIGWYNYIYSPHRNGGLSGAAQGDNCNYGNLFLLGMNNDNGMFRININSSSIYNVYKYGKNTWNFYTSVEELGQTEGSATISAVWAAMPDCSMLICQASQFASGDRPSTGGSSAIIVIVRRASGRGWLYAYGKGESHRDARMFLNSSNVPTGTWNELADFVVDTYDERVTTNVPITWTIRKYHSGICEAFGIGDSTGYPMTQQYTNGYYFASRFDLPASLFTSVTYATVERSGGSNTGGLITASTYGFDTTKVQFYAFDTRSETINCSFMCHVFGKWK